MSESPCPNKPVCGSCKWSHIPYEKQLLQKLSDINGSFAIHETLHDGAPLRCEEILPAPVTSHYRNRMDFAIDYQGKVGLREKGKWWRVLDGHHCFISDKAIEDHFHKVREWSQQANLSYFDRRAHTGLLRYAVIRSSLLGEQLLTIITSKPEENEREHVQATIAQLAEVLPDTHIVWSIAETVSDVSRGEIIVPINKEPYIREKIRDYTYRVHPFTFFQTNSRGAELLLDTVEEFAAGYSGDRFVDLYCGSGFFTIPLSRKFKHSLGIELEEEAIARARENALLNGVEVEFIAGKTEASDWHKQPMDFLLVDPPRSGMHDKALKQLQEAKPETVLYVSCNYKSLARELKILENDYRVEKMKAIDMFPHTPHVEVVSLLKAI